MSSDARARREEPPARIALLSPCGAGNLGDAAIIDSVVHAVRRRRPDAAIIAFTQNPEDTRSRHGIEAYSCSGFSTGGYGVSQERDAEGQGTSPSAQRALLLGVKGRARAFANAVPGLDGAWRLCANVRADMRHRRLSLERSRGLECLVVAGGGQLDEFWGGPFAHPYVLWRWARTARRLRARHVVLSVGTGTLSSPLSRLFVRRALALSDYRSFRDDGSRSLLGEEVLTRHDPTVPDLAYGLPVDAARGGGAAERRLIAVSPMAYCDPRIWPERDAARYGHHVRSLAAFVALLAARDHQVALFATARADNRTAREVHEALPAPVRERVRLVQVAGVPDLLDLLRGADAVVASRLHGVLLSHLLHLPVLALSYERKVVALMRDMDQEDLCVSIDAFTPEEGWRRLQDLMARRQAIVDHIARRTATFRARVEEQYDRVFGEVRS